MVTRVLLPALLASTLAACSAGGDDGEKRPSPDTDDDQSPVNEEQEQENDDDVPEKPSACAALIGTYVYSVDPHLVRGPCESPTATGKVAFFDSTQDHSFFSEGASCTVTATTVEDNGCTHIDLLTCGDGSSVRTVCDVNEDASEVKCTGTTDFVSTSCDVAFEATRVSGEDECTPLGGLYQAAVTRTAGQDADGCMPSSTVELTNDAWAAFENTTACSWNEAVLADDLCSLTQGAECEDGDFAGMDCTWNTDSTEATCKLTSGPCAYTLELVR